MLGWSVIIIMQQIPHTLGNTNGKVFYLDYPITAHYIGMRMLTTDEFSAFGPVPKNSLWFLILQISLLENCKLGSVSPPWNKRCLQYTLHLHSPTAI